ncbi:AcrR family transcriptional regulator [Actinoplanes lutulentus]|nr:hypothetical protein [Actinoplanes lutulentus]MBB2948971.1 AcrR family transcriptional regulator [Actinoplanes lutulentus]
MNHDELQQAVVRAAWPLLGEYPRLTLARIAEAAGITEADLLTVFPDPESVLEAAMATVMTRLSTVIDPAVEVRELEAIPVDQPLEARLVAVIEILDAYQLRVAAGVRTIEQIGIPAGTPVTRTARPQDAKPAIQLPEVRQAVARLLEPEGERLRIPAEILAEIFLGISRVGAQPINEEQHPTVPAEQIIDLFLHGALR